MGPCLPELWILRHGETAWNVQGRLQGRLDSPLTGTGRAQARTQREILGEILENSRPEGVSALSSPSGRAWRTAEIALAGLGVDLRAEPDLREIDIGRWAGRQIGEITATLPPEAARDPHLWKFTAPGGETLPEMVARLTGLLDRLEGPTVIVTHGVTSRVLRCLALGRPVEEMAKLPGGQGVVHHLQGGAARVIGA